MGVSDGWLWPAKAFPPNKMEVFAGDPLDGSYTPLEVHVGDEVGIGLDSQGRVCVRNLSAERRAAAERASASCAEYDEVMRRHRLDAVVRRVMVTGYYGLFGPSHWRVFINLQFVSENLMRLVLAEWRALDGQ